MYMYDVFVLLYTAPAKRLASKTALSSKYVKLTFEILKSYSLIVKTKKNAFEHILVKIKKSLTPTNLFYNKNTTTKILKNIFFFRINR